MRDKNQYLHEELAHLQFTLSNRACVEKGQAEAIKHRDKQIGILQDKLGKTETSNADMQHYFATYRDNMDWHIRELRKRDDTIAWLWKMVLACLGVCILCVLKHLVLPYLNLHTCRCC